VGIEIQKADIHRGVYRCARGEDNGGLKKIFFPQERINGALEFTRKISLIAKLYV